MKIIPIVLKTVIIEVIIICIHIFLINNYYGKPKPIIKSDGAGYYDYLPSIFIYHDINRKDDPLKNNPNLYKRTNTMFDYVEYNGYTANKHPCGVAVLEAPFFFYTLLTNRLEGNSNDGFQMPFQKSVYYAALFYLFLGILLLKFLLKLYNIKKYIIVICQILIVFGTLLSHYTSFDVSYSHVFSFFAITGFLYFTKSYFVKNQAKTFLIACAFFGLILLLRQINGLIIFFVPFLAGSWKDFCDQISTLIKRYKLLIIGLVLVVLIFSLQCLAWYLQTGKWFIYSYQGYGFNFGDPYFFSILFSYKKGLFIYTPLMFLASIGIFWQIYKRRYYLAISWLFFFSLITYIMSCWYSWTYSSCFGLRVYIDFYAVFMILFALMLNESGRILKTTIILLSVLTIPVNIIQTYQYKNYILPWGDEMNRDLYWKVFLKTRDKYAGITWKVNYDYNQYKMLKEVNLGDVEVSANSPRIVLSDSSRTIPEFQNLNLIRIMIDDKFEESSNAIVTTSINECNTDNKYFMQSVYLLHFADQKFDQFQTGNYNFSINPVNDSKVKIVKVEIKSDKNILLKNVRVQYYGKK